MYFGECGLPYGLYVSLCTLRLFCSMLPALLIGGFDYLSQVASHCPLRIRDGCPNGGPANYLLHRRNTRYGWLAKPYPAGTFTRQEAPSLLLAHKGGVPLRKRSLDTPFYPFVDIFAVAYTQNQNIFVLQLQDNSVISDPQLPITFQRSSERF